MLRFLPAAAVFSLSVLAFTVCDIRPALAEDTVFRCGTESVSIGDSRYTVQKLCGKPSRSETAAKESTKTAIKEPGRKAAKPSSGKREKWYYDRGYGDFVYALTFENGTLKKIDKAGRGR